MSGPISGEVDLATQSTMRLVGSGAGYVGSGVASAGDTNGDGLADIVIGQYGEPDECVLVFTGPVSGDLVTTDADGTFSDSLETQAGISPRSAGDVNADGYDDVAFEGTGFDEPGENAGAAFLFLGPFAGYIDTADAHARFEGAAAHYEVSAVDGAGDVNGDGFADLVVGAPGAGGENGSDAQGAAFVEFGPLAGVSSLADASVVILGESGNFDADESGGTVAGAGDIDGDGLADILIGGGADSQWAPNGGAAWLVFGSQMR